MRFSLSLPLLHDPGTGDPYHETFALAAIAEEAGFDTATIGHHHFLPGNQSDPLTFLAAVAVRTSTLRVGTGIFQLPVHHPLRVAEQVATIDQLSGGRISLGVGTGWWPLEYTAHGSTFEQRGARMDEALGILRHVWTQEHTAWEGRFWSFPELTVHPRPVQVPHPPLWVAGVADVAVDRAARLGDAWLCGPVQSLAKARSCLARYRRSWAEVHPTPDAGTGGPGPVRGPAWILRRYAWVGTDRAAITDDILPRYVAGLLAHWRESVEDPDERALFDRIDAGEPVSAEDVARDRLLWGTPDDVVAQVARYRDETGADHVHAAFGAGLPADTARASLGSFDELAAMVRLFGREVITAFP